MATIATCVTDGCPESGIPKTMAVPLHPGESVYCGECRYPAELSGDAPARIEPQAAHPSYRNTGPQPGGPSR
jgi:hypothetical protein